MRPILFISLILIASQITTGQTTRPDPAANGAASAAIVPPAWERLATSLAAAAAAHDPQALQAILPATCLVHRFNAERDVDLSPLVGFTSANTVLGDHAYLYPPQTLAADIAHDVTVSPATPDLTKRTLALDDKAGQSVALQWLTQTLAPEDTAPIAVIVLWNARPDQDSQRRPMFMLIKGEKDGDGFKIAQVVYGDPLQ